MRLSQEDERAGESQSIENQKTILEKYALDNGYDIVMFGHTHVPFLEVGKDVTILNPGSTA